MSRLPKLHRDYNLQMLTERHKNICRLVAAGIPIKDVAQLMGCTTAMVSYTHNSDIGRRYISKLSEGRDAGAMDFLAYIKEALVNKGGLDRYVELMTSRDTPANVQARVLIDALNREGSTSGVGTQTIRSSVVHTQLTEEEKQELIQRRAEARQVGRASGNIVSGELVDDTNEPAQGASGQSISGQSISDHSMNDKKDDDNAEDYADAS